MGSLGAALALILGAVAAGLGGKSGHRAFVTNAGVVAKLWRSRRRAGSAEVGGLVLHSFPSVSFKLSQPVSEDK